MKDPRITALEEKIRDLQRRFNLPDPDQEYLTQLEAAVQTYVPPDAWVRRYLSDLNARRASPSPLREAEPA